MNRKKEVIDELNDTNLSSDNIANLEKELHDIIIKLAQIK